MRACPLVLGRAHVPQARRAAVALPLLRASRRRCRARAASAAPGEALVLEGLGTEKLEETLVRGVPRGARRAARSRRRERQRKVEAVLARDARARDRHPRRHADGDEGPRPAARDARGRRQRRRGAVASPTFARPSGRSSSSCRWRGARGGATCPGRVLVQTYDPEHPAVALRGASTTSTASSSASSSTAASSATRRSRASRSSASTRWTRGGARGVRARWPRSRGARAREARGVDVLGPAAAPIARLRAPVPVPRDAPLGRPREAARGARRGRPRARGPPAQAFGARIDMDPVQFL